MRRLLAFMARDEHPFFLIVTVLFGAVLVQAGVVLWLAHDWLVLGILAVVGLVHIGVHWLAARALERSGLIPLYLLVQNLLIAAMVALTRNEVVLLGGAFMMMGEAAGFLPRAWIMWLVVCLEILGLMSGLCLISGWETVRSWGLAVIPVVAFVVLYVRLYLRQMHARILAQDQARRIEALTRQAERQRMARELHDNLAQGLAGLVMQIEAAQAHLSAGRTGRVGPILDGALQGARDCLVGAREVIDDARTPDEEREPLALVAQLVAEFDGLSGTAFRFSGPAVPSGELLLPPGGTLELESLVREALRNVVNHAKAKECLVEWQGDERCLAIRDDGQGFDPARVPPSQYGLAGMRERAALLGARLEVSSRPGSGSCLRIRFGPVRGRP